MLVFVLVFIRASAFGPLAWGPLTLAPIMARSASVRRWGSEVPSLLVLDRLEASLSTAGKGVEGEGGGRRRGGRRRGGRRGCVRKGCVSGEGV